MSRVKLFIFNGRQWPEMLMKSLKFQSWNNLEPRAMPTSTREQALLWVRDWSWN